MKNTEVGGTRTMKLPVIEGNIKRRILINYQIKPQEAMELLPNPFRPKLIKGKAIMGICLIRLENIRPSYLSWLKCGITSENAAHRIAVEWEENSISKEGVYIFRRDTNSLLNHLGGGKIFPGEHKRSKFIISEIDKEIDFKMISNDGEAEVKFKGWETDNLPSSSVFNTMEEISRFFRGGSDGYSPTKKGNCLQGMCLVTHTWNMIPLHIETLDTTYFNNILQIPQHTVNVDSVVIMRDISHQWRTLSSINLGA
jgi:hypothetical protein